MIVICQKCGKETNHYVFDKELKPVCGICDNRELLMNDIVFAEEKAFNSVFNDDEQFTLQKWIK